MFTCPSCKSETPRLCTTGRGHLGCPNCADTRPRVGGELHKRAGLSGEAKNITVADKKHILNRAMGPDGNTCVCKNDPSKRWVW
jgi:hypothetical protein